METNQFKGLFDKNGHRIEIGDTLKDPDGKIVTVCFGQFDMGKDSWSVPYSPLGYYIKFNKDNTEYAITQDGKGYAIAAGECEIISKEPVRSKVNYDVLDKLFACKWNYTWQNVGVYIISLFYKKGGFKGLYESILSEQKRMKDFDNFYSSDLPELLKQAKEELTDEDFRTYIFTKPNLYFHSHNFLILEKYELLHRFEDFSSSFRCDIESIHKIGDYEIIECIDAVNKNHNYFVKNHCYSSLEEALVNSIFGGQFEDTLSILLKSIEK
jgi:hypothetical protein